MRWVTTSVRDREKSWPRKADAIRVWERCRQHVWSMIGAWLHESGPRRRSDSGLQDRADSCSDHDCGRQLPSRPNWSDRALMGPRYRWQIQLIRLMKRHVSTAICRQRPWRCTWTRARKTGWCRMCAGWWPSAASWQLAATKRRMAGSPGCGCSSMPMPHVACPEWVARGLSATKDCGRLFTLIAQ